MSRDLRKYTQQTNLRLILGALIILFVIGDGLILLFYGSSAALTGFLCLLAGMIPIGLIAAIGLFLDWFVKRANGE